MASKLLGQADPNQHLKDVLKNSLFGAFLNTGSIISANNNNNQENSKNNNNENAAKQVNQLGNGIFMADIEQKEDEQIIMSQSVHSEGINDDDQVVAADDHQLWSDQEDEAEFKAKALISKRA